MGKPRLTLSDSARARLADELRSKHITQRELAVRLQWSQSRVGKTLTGVTPITVDALGAICDAIEISPVEVVRDTGLEFVADLTPFELRLLERFRSVDQDLQNAIALFLKVKKPTTPQRYAKDPHGGRRLPRPPITEPLAASSK